MTIVYILIALVFLKLIYKIIKGPEEIEFQKNQGTSITIIGKVTNIYLREKKVISFGGRVSIFSQSIIDESGYYDMITVKDDNGELYEIEISNENKIEGKINTQFSIGDRVELDTEKHKDKNVFVLIEGNIFR